MRVELKTEARRETFREEAARDAEKALAEAAENGKDTGVARVTVSVIYPDGRESTERFDNPTWRLDTQKPQSGEIP